MILSIFKNLYISKLARVFDGLKRIENLENPDPKLKLVIFFLKYQKFKKNRSMWYKTILKRNKNQKNLTSVWNCIVLTA